MYRNRMAYTAMAVAAISLSVLLLMPGCQSGEEKNPVSSDSVSQGQTQTSLTESSQTDPAQTDPTQVDGSSSDTSTTASGEAGDSTSASSSPSRLPSSTGTANHITARPTTGNASSTSKVTTTTTKKESATTTTKAPTTPAPSDKVTMNFRQPGDTNTLGVWWWNVSSVKTAKADTYLNFCQQNKVSEIYLCIDGMQASSGTSYADVRAFVKKAGSKGMRVAALTGDVSWINPGNTGFQKYVSKFNAYQKAAAKDEQFYAMHLDVEPHQHSDFRDGDDGRAKVMQWFADFVVDQAVPAAKAAGTLLEWDIPFWMTDLVRDQNDRSIVLAELMARECDTIAVMSYRDTARAMWDVGKEEVAYAKKYGHKVILGAETKSSEGDNVSYMEEGKAVMVSELTKLNDMLLENVPDRQFGLAIHQIDNWYNLKN